MHRHVSMILSKVKMNVFSLEKVKRKLRIARNVWIARKVKIC